MAVETEVVKAAAKALAARVVVVMGPIKVECLW